MPDDTSVMAADCGSSDYEVAHRRIETAAKGYKDDGSQMVLGVEEAS